MNDAIAQSLVKKYVCSKCWGHVQLFTDPVTRWRVTCPKCGDGQGFVTKYYAESRRADSRGEKMEVDVLLETLGIIENLHKGKTPEQLLKELGF